MMAIEGVGAAADATAIVDTTAQQVAPVLDSIAPALNSAFHEWNYLAVVVPSIIGLAALGYQILRYKHEEMRAIEAVFRDVVASMFFRTILREFRHILSLVDDHLPHALTEEHPEVAGKSRFNVFCAAIRGLNDAEAERGRYVGFVQDLCGRTISDTAKRLLDCMEKAESGKSSPLTNPTGITYAMEGDAVLRFVFLADLQARTTRLIRWYYRSHALFYTMCFAVAASLVPVVPAVLINRRWAEWLAVGGAVAFGITVVVLIVAAIVHYRCLRVLERMSKQYQRPGGVEHAFSATQA